MQRSESSIIAECQAGHMDSFVFFYDAYVEKIYNFIYFRTMHRESAEDLTSQTFIKALEKIQTFNPTKGTFQAWIYQIARNLLIDEYRKRKPIENIDAHENLRSSVDLEDETQKQFDSDQIRKLLAELPEDAQELVTMRLWNELPYADIAEITGKSEGSLKMQFSRIITKLQQQAHLLVLTLIILWS